MAGIGTGGTISGVGRYLKEQDPDVRVVAADPEGSILSGDQPKPWAVEGIGEDYVPKTLNPQVVDEWIRVSDADSLVSTAMIVRPLPGAAGSTDTVARIWLTGTAIAGRP